MSVLYLLGGEVETEQKKILKKMISHLLEPILSILYENSSFLGRIAGWGKAMSGGSPSEILKIVELPTIDRAQCIAESDIEFRPFITPDKFCAGLLNSNVSICQGQFFSFLLLPFMIFRNVFDFR